VQITRENQASILQTQEESEEKEGSGLRGDIAG
jgi:hypothetical protein